VISTPRDAGFNVPLNGYRGLCAFLVFLYHVANAGVIALDAFGAAAGYVLSSFRYGVEMFFMISGFVISLSIGRHARLSSFLRDRFVRIYSAWAPLLIVVTVVCSSFDMKMFTGVSGLQSLWLFIANLFLLPPLIPVTLVHAVSWSLTYEWVFYFAAATFVLLTRRPRAETRIMRTLWSVIVAVFVCLFPRSLFFLPGVIVFRYARWFERHRSWLQLPWISLTVFLLAWRYTRADKAELTETMLDWAQDGRLLAAAVALVAAIHLFASVTLRATSQFAFLESAAFQFLGKVSYSFYLWHLLVVSAVKRVIGAFVIPHTGAPVGVLFVLVVAFAISLPLAWATWLVLEVRLAKLMRAVLSPAPQPLEPEQSRATSWRDDPV
jgi:peptidoglycan/LPS O-acetylase OafA/YrhL